MVGGMNKIFARFFYLTDWHAFFLLFLFLFMVTFSVPLSAQEKQLAMMPPMGALGEFSAMEKQIIFNSL